MRHPIDPKIDCVFKALLGAEANRRLLIHFLNAVLGTDLPAPVAEVAILSPYNEREFQDDKLSIVDVKARDDHGRVFQVEIQLLVLPELPARILYGWADLYSAQLQSGQDYGELKPTYSIWLLGETLRRGLPDYLHRLRMRDDRGRVLIDHGGICLLELDKFAAGPGAAREVETELERWLKFFTEGEGLDEQALPDWMQTEEMREAMSTLMTFSEKEREYHVYQARQNYLRRQRSIQRRLGELDALQAATEQARAAAEHERAEKDAALEREAAALAEIERLRRLLGDQPGA
ncbi:Rpn family recombination-promoting nuclease/putative transposase [uncultured Thiodictyon sp.]|jgi:predicted transposase/invertase (TIGR01784 family)|uniref:Rpn family recombination-promoting nuclease/putative transposase n=1 Tax=uncultured Thiodictyon sp. TaxID=1846217 RepID=UPI0025F94107|nr:Rpn family recombination-promoting nuclease/putative transposase [uncultured Thiodictyon sp.]